MDGASPLPLLVSFALTLSRHLDYSPQNLVITMLFQYLLNAHFKEVKDLFISVAPHTSTKAISTKVVAHETVLKQCLFLLSVIHSQEIKSS